MKSTKFEMLSHTADIKFKIFASSLNEIFQNSARAFSSYVSSGKTIKNKQTKQIKIKSDNKESLLYNFIDELIFLLDAENFIISTARVKIDKSNQLVATLSGDNVKNYSLNHVKAATYAEMYIKNKGKTWEAQLVLDV